MSDALWVPAFSDLMSTARQFYDRAVTLYAEYAVRAARADHPGASYGMGSDGAGGWQADLEAAAYQKASADARVAFADVLDLFQAFAECPDPAAFTGAAEDLQAAQEALAIQAGVDPLTNVLISPARSFSRISTVGDFIGDWSGAAARQFKANYLDRLPAQIGTQFQLILALRGAVLAEQEVWRMARTDICVLAAKGLAALDDLGNCTQAEWTMAFTVVASVAAVTGAAIAAPETGGASLVMAVSVVGAASQVAAAVPIEGSARQVDYHGDTPQAVVAAVRLGIHDLCQRIKEQESGIAGAISDDVDLIDRCWQELRPDPPDLGYATEGTVTNDHYFGSAR